MSDEKHDKETRKRFRELEKEIKSTPKVNPKRGKNQPPPPKKK